MFQFENNRSRRTYKKAYSRGDYKLYDAVNFDYCYDDIEFEGVLRNGIVFLPNAMPIIPIKHGVYPIWNARTYLDRRS